MNYITSDTGFTFLQKRRRTAHKGSYGTLTAVCGCEQYRGAAALAVDCALRSGAGIVRLAGIEKVISSAAIRCPEAVFLPLQEENGQIVPDVSPILAQKSNAYLIGCGFPKTYQMATLTEGLLRGISQGGIVLDAGALTSLFSYGKEACLQETDACVVVTPHVGELSAMTGVSIDQIQENMEEHALSFAQSYRCVTVLKSHRTVIATPTGTLWESNLGSCGLARGGSGDCLAGILASFLCQGYDRERAAVCALWLQGMASQWAAQEKGTFSMLPRDLADGITAVFAQKHW